MNQRRSEGGVEKSRSRSPASLSDWARKSLLMSAYAFYNAATTTAASAPRPVTSPCTGKPDAAYAQYLIAASHYDQIPDITAIRPDRKGNRRARRSNPQVSDVGIFRQRQGQAQGARDQLAGREMNGPAAITWKSATTRRDQPLQRPWSPSTRPRGMSRKRWPG